jgi:drug/metabolite transporter (DMT)-like permease
VITSQRPSHPIGRGGLLAVLAALSFGAVTPFIQRFGSGAGPFATAALLYAGAALASVGRSAEKVEAPVRTSHISRLLVVAIAGALVAPACFAWGLQRTGATSASLLLNCEAFFTVLFARAFYGESIGKRVASALVLMAAGGASLVFASDSGDQGLGVGAIAIVVATLAWSFDNTIMRPLADLDPIQVVRWKGALGAALGIAVAIGTRDRVPSVQSMVGLLICGATGYGMSLRLYLLAQRKIGAARTGSIFALAPFVGAGAAWAMGDRALGTSSWIAAALFGVGVYLHLTERHEHAHTHEPIEHEHAHRHDDGHHDHHSGEWCEGQHSHPHRHDARTHDHAHGPDAHHRHRHERE